MSRERTRAVIYKLIKYADSSAIGFAFTEDFGRVKLFIPKAYTKKGGVMCFIPGVLDFGKKSTDLSRYYSFDAGTEYIHYLNSHEIVMRMHLIYEVLDGLIEPELPDRKLFELLTKFDDSNFRKITPYVIYFILKKAGVMFNLNACENCGAPDADTVAEKGLYCDNCADQLNINGMCDSESAYILKSMGNSALYRNISVNRKQELQLIKALAAYCSHIMEKQIKSLKTVLDII